MNSKQLEFDFEKDVLDKLKLTHTSQMHSATIPNIYKYGQEVLSTDGAHIYKTNAEFCHERNVTNNEATNFVHNPIIIDLTFDDFVIDQHLKITKKPSSSKHPVRRKFKPIQDIVEEIREKNLYYLRDHLKTPKISKGSKIKSNTNIENRIHSPMTIKPFERKYVYENPVPFQYLPPSIKPIFPSPPSAGRSGIYLTPTNNNFGSHGYSESKNLQYFIEPDRPAHTTEMSHLDGYILRNSTPSIDESCTKYSLPRNRQKYSLMNASNKMAIYGNHPYQLPDNMPFQYVASPRSRMSSPYDPVPYEISSTRGMDNFSCNFEAANLQFWDGPVVQDNIYVNGRRIMPHLDEYTFRNSTTPAIGRIDELSDYLGF